MPPPPPSASAAGGRGRGAPGPHLARRRPLRRWPRRILITTNVIVALSVVLAASVYGYVQWRLGQINRVTVLGLTVTGHSKQSEAVGSSSPPFSMLVVGSDSRNLGQSGACSRAGQGTGTGGQRSDSIILVRVIPKTRQIALLSIPRDTLAAIPGQGTTRINSAFNSGNPNLLVQVLKNDFNIEINHFAEFNFDTFCDVANAIGGIQMYFPAPGRDFNSGFGVPAGCINLTGGEALAFVRSREYQYFLNGEWHDQLYPESDLARIQRQQAFTRAAVKKAEKVAPTNPATLNSVIGGITKNLTLDSGFSNSLILNLAKDFHSANLSNVPSFTYPTVNSTSVPGALDPEQAAGAQTVAQWLNGGVAPTPAPTTTTAATTKAAPAPTINPASLVVRVLNGSGVSGQATATSQALSSLGYHASVGSGSVGYNNPTTVIHYAPGAQAAAQQLERQVVGGATLQEDGTLASAGYNLELITGHSYNGIVGVASSSSTTSSSTTSPPSPAFVGTSTINPDSSSTFNGQYIPPGRVAGQVIPNNCGN